MAVTHVAREPNKIIAVRRFSLVREIDANVGNNQEASSRSMIKFRTILATSGPLLRQILGGKGLSAIRPHGKDTAKHEKPPHTPRRRHRLALTLRGCGTTRSIKNAIDSFAKSITHISNSWAESTAWLVSIANIASMVTHSREQHDVPPVKVHHMFPKSSIDCVLPADDRTHVYELHYVSVQDSIRRIA